MALDFPSSPTNGQVYGNYTYDSTKGAWRVTAPSSVNNAIVSPTAPSSPTAGNVWYNSTDGNTYIYYNDGDTSQWVQLKSDATLSSTLGNRVTSLESTPSGLVPIVPSSVTITGGSATVNTYGLVTATGTTDIALNNCFSSAYDRYKIVISLTYSGDQAFLMKLRAAGTQSSTGYYQGGYYIRTNGSAGAWGLATNGGYWMLGNSSALTSPSGNRLNFPIEVVHPFESVNTSFVGQSVSQDSTGVYTTVIGGMHDTTSSYDGFYMWGSNGAAFGATVQVFGYRK